MINPGILIAGIIGGIYSIYLLYRLVAFYSRMDDQKVPTP